MNYLVADFIIRIKNASLARRKQVIMPYSNINKAIAKTLVKAGLLADIKESEVDGKKKLIAGLRYENRRPVVSDVVIVSKPSLRVYVNATKVREQAGKDAMTSVFSTNAGVMTGKEAAKKGVGGELLFRVW
jgi:small subunit ribosomal protein S8